MTVAGIGTDIEEIERIRALMANPRFLERFFGPEERELLRAGGMKPQSVAANFCAKEAFAKALGTGVRGFCLNQVQLLRDELGKPFFLLSGAARLIAENRGLSFMVSASHSRSYATAVVIALCRDGGDGQ